MSMTFYMAQFLNKYGASINVSQDYTFQLAYARRMKQTE